MRIMVFILLLVSSVASLGAVNAGFAKLDITPTVAEASSSCLGGYTPFTRCAVTKVHNEISVRSLALSSGWDSQLIVTSIDTIGLGQSLIDEIQERVALVSFGFINPEAVFLTATHTHHGPDLQGLWGGVSPEYRERIIQSAVQATLSAFFSQEPARVYASEATAAVINRRGWSDVDSTLRFIEFKSKRHNRSIATLVNMSAHPTIIDRSILAYSTDYVGALRDTVEDVASTNALFINGVVGDATPFSEGDGTLNTADQYGSDMGAMASLAMQKEERINGSLRLTHQEFTHPVKNEAIIGAIQAGLLDAKLNKDSTVTTQFGYFSIGRSLSGIIFPGEALSRLGLPLLEALPGEHKLFFGLSGDSFGYFIPSDEFLAIPNRTTEEQLSIHPLIGDSIGSEIQRTIESRPSCH